MSKYTDKFYAICGERETADVYLETTEKDIRELAEELNKQNSLDDGSFLDEDDILDAIRGLAEIQEEAANDK